MALILDSGAITELAPQKRKAAALIQEIIAAELWPPIVPTVVKALSANSKSVKIKVV